MSSRLLNVAQICPATWALGPGKRFAVWVQGCPFSCAGCVAPDWIPFQTSNLVEVEMLGQQITSVPDLEGITISGGEPMMQAQALSDLIDHLTAKQPGLSVIIFSGFTLAQLERKSVSDQGIAALLERTDVLVDGLYVKEANDGRGLRGSSNQTVNFLSDRYLHAADELSNGSRRTEMHVIPDNILLVGIPSMTSLQSFHLSVERLRSVDLAGGEPDRTAFSPPPI